MALQIAKRLTTGDHLPRMTYEEYRDWAKDHPHSEWVDGEVIEFMSVTGRQSLIVVFLIKVLGAFVDHRRLGLVFSEPYAMLIREGRASRQPDVGVLLSANLHRFIPDQDHLEGPADLVIEVVSEDSPTRDREKKVEDYPDAGVPEYWIFEGREGRQGVELYVRNEAGTYDRRLPDAEGRLHSSMLPGFWLDPAWMTEDPLPDVDDLLDQIIPGIHEERAERARQRRTARGAD